jgi:4-amino-4-deoxy-L-arabinose transferase-like glycosyltransferase
MPDNKMRQLRQGQPSLRHELTRILHLIDVYPFRAVGAFLVLGILLSVIVMATHPPSLNSGETDSWWTIALNLIHSHGYSLCLPRYFPFCGPSNQVTATREPVPVFLFAAAAWFGNDSLGIAEIVEAIIYLAIIVAIYFLTREWADTRSAVIASFLWTIYRPALELIPQVSGDLLAALFITLAILFTLRARRTRQARDWVIAGIGLGISILSRSATLVIAVIVIGGQIVDALRHKLPPKDVVKSALLLSCLVILITTPWLLRNRVVMGRLLIGSSLTGYNLYRHNHMLGSADYFRYVGPDEGLQVIEELISRHPDLRGDENEAQMDLIYRSEALRIIKSHPAQYLLLSAYRFFPLWFDWKIAEAYGRPTNRYGYVIMTLQALLLALALVGLYKNVRQTWPLWGSILAISLAYLAVDARLLYVMPVMPLVMSLSGLGGNKLLDKLFRQ